MQGTVALELRGALASAQAQAAAAEERASAAVGRVAAAEERHQHLEAALNESHSSLQQRNAELALVKKVGWKCSGCKRLGCSVGATAGARRSPTLPLHSVYLIAEGQASAGLRATEAGACIGAPCRSWRR